ncbi:hypothetical protein TNCV_2544611 [Trichonephila clavipes]|nr:hypothetical protein TNCV_2544611 [Trichonephila clavipes]
MSDRKGSTTGNVHPGRNKKRKFSGNRFTTQNNKEFTSASARNLNNSMNMEVPPLQVPRITFWSLFQYLLLFLKLKYIWIFVPKHLHFGTKIAEIATYLSVIIFNEGFVGVMMTMGCLTLAAKRILMYRNVMKRASLVPSDDRQDVVKQERIDARAKLSALKEFKEEG